LSDENYDYAPKPGRGRKAKPTASPAPRKRAAAEEADYTPRPARRERTSRGSGQAASPARKKRRSSRSPQRLKLGSLLRSRAFVVVAGIIGLVVLVGASVLTVLWPPTTNTPSGSPVDQGNYYYDQALTLWDAGNYDGALTALRQAASYYEQALAQTPADAQVRTDLGAVYFYESRLLSDAALLQQAIDTWNVALQYEPDKVETIFNLGLGYAGLGEIDQAIAMWQRVINLAPDSDAAQSAMQLIQEYSGVTGP
jgi:tetratricopeptide (TPR) repeat protein